MLIIERGTTCFGHNCNYGGRGGSQRFIHYTYIAIIGAPDGIIVGIPSVICSSSQMERKFLHSVISPGVHTFGQYMECLVERLGPTDGNPG